MTHDEIKTEIEKLNATQRSVMRSIWNGRGISKVFVSVLPFGSVIVRVCSPKGIWLVVELGPKGGIKSKVFQLL